MRWILKEWRYFGNREGESMLDYRNFIYPTKTLQLHNIPN